MLASELLKGDKLKPVRSSTPFTPKVKGKDPKPRLAPIALSNTKPSSDIATLTAELSAIDDSNSEKESEKTIVNETRAKSLDKNTVHEKGRPD